MDRQTLSNYGWIVIAVLILAVMLAFATPFGKYIGRGVANLAISLVGTSDNAVDSNNIEQMQDYWDDYLGNTGIQIENRTVSFAEKFSNITWMTGQAFSVNGFNADGRYFVSQELIDVKAGTILLNPDTSTYFWAYAFYDSNGNVVGDLNFDNEVCLEIAEDTKIRIAIKFQDNTTMTDALKTEILGKFTVATSNNTTPSVSQKTFTFAEKYGSVNWLVGKSLPITQEDARYFVSEQIIEVKAGTTIINPDNETYYFAYLFYDKDGNQIGEIVHAPTGTAFESVEIDEDTYIRIAIKFMDNRTMSDALKTNILSKFKVTTFGSTPAKKLKCSFLGDSITEGINTTKTYHEYLAEWCNIEAKNFGANGSCISTYILDESKHYYCMVERVETVDKDSDVVFVFGGTNDFNRGCPMGTFESKDKNTFKGALAVMLQYLKDNFPDKKIYLMTPIRRGTFASQPTDLQANVAGLYLTDYVNAIKEAGELFDIEVIDLHSLTGLNPNDKTCADEYFHNSGSIDNLHPNANGHRVIAETIKKYLNW